jgi:hypothetical protein
MKTTDTIIKYASSFTIKGDWAYRAKQLKKEFPELTDADLLFERGRENELITRLETRLNKNREEVISIIKKVRLERI